MKILYTYWFSDMMGGQIGVVVGEDEITKERKAYIGIAGGQDQQADVEAISTRGQKLFPALLEEILRRLKPDKSK